LLIKKEAQKNQPSQSDAGFQNGAIIGLTPERISLQEMRVNVMDCKKYRQKYRHLQK